MLCKELCGKKTLAKASETFKNTFRQKNLLPYLSIDTLLKEAVQYAPDSRF
jgi:hypothetical protein